MISRCTLLALLGLGMIGAAGSEQGGAPLEGTKQELKQLQADQAAKRNAGTTDKLTEGLPQIQTPRPGVQPLEIPAPGKPDNERKGKNDPGSNWLVDGVEKLSESTNRKSRNKDASQSTREPRQGERERPEISDPDYLLKTYLAQKQADDATKAEHKKGDSPRIDPFAPFLQGWLQASPVRGRFFDDFLQKSEGSGNLFPAEHGPAEQESRSIYANESDNGGRGRNLSAVAPANPYLTGLEAAPLRALESSRNQPDTVGNPLSIAAPRPSPAGLPESISVSRPIEKKSPFSAQDDDKKYFPQLKKF